MTRLQKIGAVLVAFFTLSPAGHASAAGQAAQIHGKACVVHGNGHDADHGKECEPHGKSGKGTGGTDGSDDGSGGTDGDSDGDGIPDWIIPL